MASPSAASIDRATRLLRDRVRTLFLHLPGALAGNGESIHQMRVAGRRLRVALPLLGRKPDGKRLRRNRKRLRELIRTGGASRDLDVSLALFEERQREAIEAPSRELLMLRRRLRAAHTRSRTRMFEALLELDIAGLRSDLSRIVSRRGEGLFVVFARLREERDRQAAALLAGLDAQGDHYDPDALHRLRILARRLRYLAELSVALKDHPSEAPVLFKELQDQLGRIHDAHVLAAWLAVQATADERRGRGALAAEARRQEAALRESSLALHRSWLERGPASLVGPALEAMGFTRSAA